MHADYFEKELGEYYCNFFLVLHFLVTKGCTSTQMQARKFLASLEPRLATAVYARQFPDHFPDDWYNIEGNL